MWSYVLWPLAIVTFEALVFVVMALLIRMAARDHLRNDFPSQTETVVMSTPPTPTDADGSQSQNRAEREAVSV